MRVHRATIALLAGFLLAAPATAGAQVYNEWSNPDGTDAASAADARHQRLIDRLNELIDQAERDRAADPRFIEDLRSVISGRERPWHTTVLADDFMDGNYTENPAWRVVAGRWWVERGWGLRSALKTESDDAQQSSEQPPDNKLTGEEVFGAVLSTILKGSGQVQQQRSAFLGEANTIVQDVFIANAFAVTLDVTSWVEGGRFEVAVYQGNANKQVGYILAYEPGGAIEMLRGSWKGTKVINNAPGPFNLEDEKQHTLEWTRSTTGAMTVTLDDTVVLEVADTGFRDPFDGVRLSGQGADVIVKSIKVDAAS